MSPDTDREMFLDGWEDKSSRGESAANMHVFNDVQIDDART